MTNTCSRITETLTKIKMKTKCKNNISFKKLTQIIIVY